MKLIYSINGLNCRGISHHPEAYVRKSALFAASCILLALNPTYVASALVEGNTEISRGLEWVRTWALSVAEADTDKECYMVRTKNELNFSLIKSCALTSN